MASQSGPSAMADWLEITPEHPTGRALWALPDVATSRACASGDVAGVRRAALHEIAVPALCLAPGSGAPLVGLTLVLSRSPDVNEDSLIPLVIGGVFSISLTTLPTADDTSRVIADARRRDPAWSDADTVVPIFVRRARWSLIDRETGAAFAEAVAQGNGTVALSQTLARELALTLLATLRGEDRAVLARCEVAFRAVADTAPQPPRQRTAHDWGDGGPSSAAQTTVVTTHTSCASYVERTVVLERPIAHLVREAADGYPLDAIVHAVSPSEDSTLRPIPRRVGVTRGDPPDARRLGLAAIGDSIVAMPAVLMTSPPSRIQASALASSDLAIRQDRRASWQISDLMVSQAPPSQNLPVVDTEVSIDGDDALWPDRIAPELFWYAPQFIIVEPPPSATAAQSPFLFSFSVVGHDQQGRPGLEARVRFTLRMGMSAATKAAWQGRNRPKIAQVPTNGLSIALVVPYRNQSGASATQTINATQISNTAGTIVATFALSDQWARLAYGALGTQRFQDRPAQLSVSYVFPAYVANLGDGSLVWGGKVATGGRLAAVDMRRLAAVSTATRESRAVQRSPSLAATSVQPSIIAPQNYGIRTQGRTVTLDAFMSCDKFGAFYVQTADPQSAGSDQAIGCRDAWTLGQIALRLYEKVDVDSRVGDLECSVFRSLQVPGRFLVVPRAYTISRYEPADARAYRPAVYLYSNVDANHPERSSCIMMATLQPAVTPGNRRALVDALRTAAHPDPMLEWPTELSVEPRYTWAIPTTGTTSGITTAAAKTPEGFQVGLATGIDQILQLKAIVETSGVPAAVSFLLADGTELQSTLVIGLRQVDGPWEAGAVEVTVSGNRASLTNMVERAADIADVLTYSKGIRVGAVPVERRLESKASLDVALPAGVDTAIARYTLVNTTASLEEVRTFIEDIYTDVVFICAFDLAAAGVRRLALEGRIVGAPTTVSATLDGITTSAEMRFVLPLTAYLGKPTLQYRVSFIAANGSARAGPWRDWRLDLQGNVIELAKTELVEK